MGFAATIEPRRMKVTGSRTCNSAIFKINISDLIRIELYVKEL